MLPQPSSDEDSSTAEEDKPTNNLNTLTNTLYNNNNHFYQQQPPFDQQSHFHSQRPQSAPHSTSQFSLDPNVLAAAAANVELKKWDEENTYYYQVAHKGVTVSRLKGSALVNGTKLLNLAGISRGKRDGILKNEKIRKVVKHGTMHLKGVWIAFDRAVFLAEQHSIADKIFPLLVVNLEHYVPIEPALIAGVPTKITPSSLFHHHPRHPRLLPQPIKFSPSALSLAPPTTNSFPSSAGWPPTQHTSNTSTTTTLPSIGFPEPFSAPPIPRSAPTTDASSVYEQAQYQYLTSTTHPNHPDLLERRHTIPNNSFHGFSHSGTGYAPTYPFHYAPGYPARSTPSEATTPSQFDYQPPSSAPEPAPYPPPSTLFPPNRPVSPPLSPPNNNPPSPDFRLPHPIPVKLEHDNSRLPIDWNPSAP